MVEGVGPGFVGVDERHTPGELFTIFRNWLALGGTVCPESVRPQMSKYQNTKNRTCLIQKKTLGDYFYCLDWQPLDTASMCMLKSLCPFEKSPFNDYRGMDHRPRRGLGKYTGEARGANHQIVASEAVDSLKRTSLGHLILL